jgi:acyl carrier protein
MSISRTSIRTAVVESLGMLLGIDAAGIVDGDNLVKQLGLDSLNAANCVVEIEERLGTRVPEGREGELVDVTTVGELIDRLVAVFDDEHGD